MPRAQVRICRCPQSKATGQVPFTTVEVLVESSCHLHVGAIKESVLVAAQCVRRDRDGSAESVQRRGANTSIAWPKPVLECGPEVADRAVDETATACGGGACTIGSDGNDAGNETDRGEMHTKIWLHCKRGGGGQLTRTRGTLNRRLAWTEKVLSPPISPLSTPYSIAGSLSAVE